MKLRYFLRGLGAGIVFTVMVMGLSGSNVEKVELTDNEIMARARALGMITKDEQIDESLNQLMNGQTTNTEDVIPETINPEEEDIVAKDVVEGTTEDETVENISEETQIVTEVTISPGMTSRQVAAAFLNVGLISNSEEFDDFLCSNGYSSRIRVGTFTIEGKPDYTELARIITTQ